MDSTEFTDNVSNLFRVDKQVSMYSLNTRNNETNSVLSRLLTHLDTNMGESNVNSLDLNVKDFGRRSSGGRPSEIQLIDNIDLVD